MKISTQTEGHQPVLVNRLISILFIVILCISESCTQTEIKEFEGAEPCFTKESLDTVPWIVDELAQFKVPLSGGYHVSVRGYRGAQYLVVGNVFLQSPISHIFNCSGVPIGQLGILYNEFCDNSELLAVLAHEGY